MPRTYIKPGMVIQVCNTNDPSAWMETEIGDSSEVSEPTGWAYVAANNKRYSLKQVGKKKTNTWGCPLHSHSDINNYTGIED